MKIIPKIQKFEEFVLERKNVATNKETTISLIKDKVKKEFGNTKNEFLNSVQKRGINEIKDFIIQISSPYFKELSNAGNYDNLLEGIISWILLEMQLLKNDN